MPGSQGADAGKNVRVWDSLRRSVIWLMEADIIEGGQNMDILRTENLKKYYGQGENQVHALDGVNLTVDRGEFLAVVGTSGSGDYVKIRLS